MTTNALIIFEDDDLIRAAETNDNNRYLENKISAVSTNLNAYLQSQIATLNQNINNLNPIGRPILALDFETLPANHIWLEGAEVSRTTYANLFAIYGTAYGEGDGSTTFNLPDCRNRVFWGGSEAGYISAGLPNITGSASIWLGVFNASSGCFSRSSSGEAVGGSGTYAAHNKTISFNASRSSSVYGGSSTVQPPAIKVRVYTRYQ